MFVALADEIISRLGGLRLMFLPPRMSYYYLLIRLLDVFITFIWSKNILFDIPGPPFSPTMFFFIC